MKLYLKNHTERYPVEQLQLQLFAQEPSEFYTKPFAGDGTVSSLSRGKRYLTATAKVTYQGKTGFAVNRVLLDRADVRATRRILQRSYYLAALQVLPAAPPWGALSGVRPTKLSTKCLMAGGSEKDAEKLLREVYFVSPERARLCVDASRHTVEAAKLLDADDLSVYIGIPFCPTRCAYCSFVSQSIERFGEFLPAYLDALLREIAHTGALLKNSGFHIRTLYMGGGTPTTLSSTQMARLLDAINRNFDLSRCLEFTVEGGRPDTLDPQKLCVIKDGGATRISINPQTFSDEVLRNIGRRHTAQDILDCYRTARCVGHDNINMDLIAGLPGDTVEGFRHSLQTAIDLDPENITVHTLTLKRASNLVVEHRAADYADVAAMVESCELLEKAGYRPYYLYRQKGTLQNLENVGWCKPGYECLYNIYIMEEVHTILSAGAGGSTKLVAPGARHGKIERIFNYKYPTEYIDRFDTILARKEGVKQFYDQYPNCGESARPQAHGGV